MNTPQGFAVCSNGCGKLLPKLDRKTARRNHAKIALKLVDIEKSHFEYVTLPTKPGHWRIIERISREITTRPARVGPDKELALDGDTVVVLEPWKTKE